MPLNIPLEKPFGALLFVRAELRTIESLCTNPQNVFVVQVPRGSDDVFVVFFGTATVVCDPGTDDDSNNGTGVVIGSDGLSNYNNTCT